MKESNAPSSSALSMRILWPLLLLLLVLASVGLGASWHLFSFYTTASSNANLKVVYTIEKGQSFGVTARELSASGLCTSEKKLRFMAALYGVDKKIKAGEYLLSGAMSPKMLLDVLTSGKVYLHKLTIPEGFTVAQIAEALENAGLGSASRMKALAFAPDLPKKMGLPNEAPSLEGYLFPDTYLFEKGVSEEAVLHAMVRRFSQVFTQKMKAKGEELGLSFNEVVTLASIIEKETGAPHERPIISSVFHNRLKKRMRLETDPTVIYGIKDFNGNITRRDLRRKTPYNTYVIRGLPPGPIASPGLSSLKAAVMPEATSFLYFVSRRDGTHHFSRTIKEHRRAVKKYILKR